MRRELFGAVEGGRKKAVDGAPGVWHDGSMFFPW